MTAKPAARIFVGIDTPDLARARAVAEAVAGHVGGVKLGLEFFNANGPDGVRAVTAPLARGGGPIPLFLDLKFHDIPNTVAGAVRAVVPLGPMILNVHAAGGPAMLRAAKEAAVFAAEPLGVAPPLVIGVTVLTSLDDADLEATGQDRPAADQALRLARLTRQAGLDGVVCSAHEIEAIRAACGPDFKLVVPGIRPAGADIGDQKRVMTPRQAVDLGADWIVIARPIVQAPDPAAAARAIAAELA